MLAEVIKLFIKIKINHDKQGNKNQRLFFWVHYLLIWYPEKIDYTPLKGTLKGISQVTVSTQEQNLKLPLNRRDLSKMQTSIHSSWEKPYQLLK